MTNDSPKLSDITRADISKREQICCVDNAPDELGYALSKIYPPPGTLKYIKVKEKKN